MNKLASTFDRAEFSWEQNEWCWSEEVDKIWPHRGANSKPPAICSECVLIPHVTNRWKHLSCFTTQPEHASVINGHGDRYSVNNTFNVEPRALKYQGRCSNMTSRAFIGGVHAGRDYCGRHPHVTDSDFRQSDSHLSCQWVCCFVLNASGEKQRRHFLILSPKHLSSASVFAVRVAGDAFGTPTE